MKLIPIVSEKDFARAYFAKLFWDESSAIDKENLRPVLAKHFQIPDKFLRSIKSVNLEIRKKLFLANETDLYPEELVKLKTYFEKPNEATIQKLILRANNLIDKYIGILTNIFGPSEMPQEIKISFVTSFQIPFYHGFTFNFLKDKIFIFLDAEKNTEIDLVAYLETILHEVAHVFLTNHQTFQEVSKKEWQTNYSNSKGGTFRNFIEENIVSSLAHGNRQAGYVYTDLGLPENIAKRDQDLEKSLYRKIIFDFFDKLKTETVKDKLAIEIPKLVKAMYSEEYRKK